MAHLHCSTGHGLSRRQVLRGLAAGAGALALPHPARTDEPAPRRIDVHHHFFPPAWLDRKHPPGFPTPAQREWSPARVLELMDQSGIATALCSLAPWGTSYVGAADAARVARACNDYAAAMIRDHPGRFGLFAAMPLPDIEASLKEIAYALDTLHADGIGLMTSYGDKWPGDPLFGPVFEELNRRGAVVYFHPTHANCCGNLIPGVNPGLVEWPFDTARAIVSLLYSGSLLRYPNIKFIFSHAGGALPALSGRIANFVARDPNAAKYAPNGAVAELVKLHYDTANATAAPAMAALMAMAPISQIVFGSDYPYFTLEENVAGLGKITLSDADRQAINRGNTARLLPKYQS